MEKESYYEKNTFGNSDRIICEYNNGLCGGTCYLKKDGKPSNIKKDLPALYEKMMLALEADVKKDSE